MSAEPQSPAAKPAGFELRVGALFAAAFVAPGVHLPFFPVWLEAEGFSAAEIAVILGAPMFLRVATTPLVTALADRVGERVHVLIAVALAALAVSALYFAPLGYGGMLAASLAFAVFWAPQIPLADALAQSGVRRFGSNYAWMRMWGSITFLVVNLVCGAAIARFGAQTVPVLLALGLAATVAAAWSAPRLGRPRKASPTSAAELPEAVSILNRSFVLMVVAYGLTTGSHGFLYGFVSIYWQSLGLSGSLVGGLWALSVIAEVVLFLAFRRLFAGWRAPALLILASALATLRWLAFPQVAPLGLGLGGFVGVQLLHAFSYGLALLAFQKFVSETVPEEKSGAAQGLAFFANGFGMAAMTLVSGWLYRAFGADGFHAAAAMTVCAIALAHASGQPQRAASGGKTSDPE